MVQGSQDSVPEVFEPISTTPWVYPGDVWVAPAALSIHADFTDPRFQGLKFA